MFEHHRIIRFQDTDAAGVVYFAQILSICHEAFEASLQAAGLDLAHFFGRGAIAVPIVQTAADFYRPLRCGDSVTVRLTPTQTGEDSFEIQYQVLQATEKLAAIATTRHVCIDTANRQRQLLTAALTQWLQQWRQADQSPTAAEPTD